MNYPLTQHGVLTAKRAVEELSSVMIQGVLYDCGLSTALVEILATQPDLDVPFYGERSQLAGERHLSSRLVELRDLTHFLNTR